MNRKSEYRHNGSMSKSFILLIKSLLMSCAYISLWLLILYFSK